MPPTIKIRAELDPKNVESGSQRASQSLSKLKSTALATAAAFGIGLGGYSLINAFRSMITEVSRNEQAFKRIDSQLRVFGDTSVDTRKRVRDLIDAQSSLANVTDREVADAFNRVLISAGDVNVAMARLPLVLDMASTGLFSTESAARNLTRAMSGQVGELGELLPELSRLIRELGTTATAAEKAKTAMGYLENTFGGLASKNVDTIAGAWQGLADAIGDFKDRVGGSFKTDVKAFIETTEALVRTFTPGTEPGIPGNIESYYDPRTGRQIRPLPPHMTTGEAADVRREKFLETLHPSVSSTPIPVVIVGTPGPTWPTQMPPHTVWDVSQLEAGFVGGVRPGRIQDPLGNRAQRLQEQYATPVALKGQEKEADRLAQYFGNSLKQTVKAGFSGGIEAAMDTVKDRLFEMFLDLGITAVTGQPFGFFKYLKGA